MLGSHHPRQRRQRMSPPFPDATPTIASPTADAAFTEGGGGRRGRQRPDRRRRGSRQHHRRHRFDHRQLQSGDLRAITPNHGIGQSYNPGTGVLTLTGTATAAPVPVGAADADLRRHERQSVDGDSDHHLFGDRCRSGSPGTATQGVTEPPSTTRPPSANVDGNAFTWTEGDAATHIDVGNDGTAVDPDPPTSTAAASPRVSGGPAAEDGSHRHQRYRPALRRADGGQHGVRGRQCDRHDPGRRDRRCERGADDHLTSANATPAAVQTLLRAIQYNNAGGDNPTDGNRVVRVTVTRRRRRDVQHLRRDDQSRPGDDAPTVTAIGRHDRVHGRRRRGHCRRRPDARRPRHRDPGLGHRLDHRQFPVGRGRPGLSPTTSAASFGNITASYNAPEPGVLTLTSSGATATVRSFQNALRAAHLQQHSDTPTTGNRGTTPSPLNDGNGRPHASTSDGPVARHQRRPDDRPALPPSVSFVETRPPTWISRPPISPT